MYTLSGAGIDPCIFQNNYGETEDYTVTLVQAIGCSAPSLPSVTNITSTGATLGWIPGCSETKWNVHITTSGGGAPSGLGSNPNQLTNSFVANGLTPGTNYEFWLASDCIASGNGVSAWIGPVAFTTLTVCSTFPGYSLTNPIVIGQAPCFTLPYINTQTNTSQNCFVDNYTGANNQSSPDVWYQFTLSAPATVQIGHCASSFDTYLHLLSSTGTQIIGNDDNGPLCVGLQASISANLLAGTYYIVAEGYGAYTGAITTNVKRTDSCPIISTLNLTCFIEGYWNGSSAMLPVLANQGVGTSSTICDSIVVELHSATSPYSLQYSTNTILQTNGSATCTFPPLSGNYYIVVKHRSALETWSANPINMNGASISYNFSTANTQAYSANQMEISPNLWGFYSGDLNYDENMDLIDLTMVENSISIFDNGYFSTDLNGDGNVDLLDSPMLETNISNFVFAAHP
jgi:hypothetical protein